MKKQIVIIGGGISGLTLLHYLHLKYYERSDINITLLEKNEVLGGTIGTQVRKECYFENGPNAFLNNKPQTLKLIKEIDIEHSLIQANEEAEVRYISVNNQLHALPTDFSSFLNFKLMNPFDKLRLFSELFVHKGGNKSESVFEFAKRRFGEKSAQFFFDPIVSGIYGGDSKKLNFKSAFPTLYQMEQDHGSLIRAMIKQKKKKEKGQKKKLLSFKYGMGYLIKVFGTRYEKYIQLNQNVQEIKVLNNNYIIKTDAEEIVANELFICTPAYVANKLLENVDTILSMHLSQINYAPIAVIGLVFWSELLEDFPKGFGYLIPSQENKEILGITFENNIFKEKCPENQIMLRVMIGGARYPNILNQPKEYLLDIALREIESKFIRKGDPQETFYATYPKAIPQYDQDYAHVIDEITKNLEEYQTLHLASNYINGISLNDCVENAYKIAGKSCL